MNYYTRIKLSYRGNIPKMEDPDERTKNPYKSDPRGITTPTPYFGGKERKGFPKGYSQYEDEENRPKEIPSGSVLVDQDPPTGEGVGNNDLSERFTDPVDKLKSFDKRLDPTGPHNMSHDKGNIYNFISNRSKIRGLNKV